MSTSAVENRRAACDLAGFRDIAGCLDSPNELTSVAKGQAVFRGKPICSLMIAYGA
jgi:hypothetical protein